MMLQEALTYDVVSNEHIYGPAWVVPLSNVILENPVFTGDPSIFIHSMPMYYIQNKFFAGCTFHNIIIDIDSAMRIANG